VVDPSEDSDDDVDDDGETKSGVLIGCLFNKLFSCFNPLEIDDLCYQCLSPLKL
jgi:hypothetical protein